ncbi:vWA domain-containing protein [Tuwongella immobilis]|uniref:VWFA domain-containing protein n=1 Tax=Tuwongella immobilis TaxID=692036 RepID=A0A6C2YQX1_9BACT|nr:vWA domain-containing protein [Tuwongella immobilis]VIP03282.1 Uncharacterized protein OS=Rhodopirellula baltica SWK14 GN=RBSWK_06204 PE=4 SV=1: VWA_2 [Tuwongella immobilis]VTS03933.1 Uncharacterized protein OS=Rhodopirellula baltica SWK14 GN=RBSWK_06204 PE=4 SV=1: VWA_2 [Tuwongella immobilis]
MVYNRHRSRVPVTVWVVSVGVHLLLAVALMGAIRGSLWDRPDRDPNELMQSEVRIEWYAPEEVHEVSIPTRVIIPPNLPRVEKPEPSKSLLRNELPANAPAGNGVSGNASGTKNHATGAAEGNGAGANGAGTGASGSPNGTGASRFAPTLLHQPAQVGQSIVYVIDASASMGVAGRYERAVDCVLHTLRASAPDSRFQVVVYASDATILPILGRTELIPMSPQAIEHAERLLRAWQPEGGSSHFVGIRKGLSLESDALVLMSDAEGMPAEQIQRIQQLNHRRSVVHTLLLAPDRDSAHWNSPMAQLSRLNRGSFRVLLSR